MTDLEHSTISEHGGISESPSFVAEYATMDDAASESLYSEDFPSSNWSDASDKFF